MRENQEPINENENIEELQDEQEAERNYFEKKEEKINSTKEKLGELLEEIKEQPEKETIKKKLLRIQIKILRNWLNRQMTKFDIEFEADQLENTEYEAFQDECEAIQEKIDELRDREDELYYQLTYHTKTENFRGEKDKRVAAAVKKMAPKGQKGKTRDIKSEPRKSKAVEIRKKLDEVQAEISKLEEELENKISDYKEYKNELKETTSQRVTETLEQLKEDEKARNRQQREEMALANPSVWSSIRAALKNVKEKFDKWKEDRKQRKAATRQRHDDENINDAEQLISKKTARENFAESIQVGDNVQKDIAFRVQEVLDENGPRTIITRIEKEEEREEQK